jgi:hypothetical protein
MGYMADHGYQQLGSTKAYHFHPYFAKQSEPGYRATWIESESMLPRSKRLSLPCWSIILHVQNIAPRRSCSRRINTGVDTCDGVVLCMSGLDRVDRDGQQDKEANDVSGTHLEQWLERKLFVKSPNCAIVARSTTLQVKAIVPC